MGLVRRWRAVLDLETKNYPHLLSRSETIFNGLSDNPKLFLTPNPPLATLLLKIQSLSQAQQKAGTRASGAKHARDAAAASLITSLETSRAYVQELADAGSPAEAASLITAAGMLLGNARTYTKPLLQATQRQPSGPVHLEANIGVMIADAQGKVFFNWESSVDGGQTWIAAPSTPHGRTDIPGLTPMSTYDFRVSITDKGGPREWSQVVALLVR